MKAIFWIVQNVGEVIRNKEVPPGHIKGGIFIYSKAVCIGLPARSIRPPAFNTRVYPFCSRTSFAFPARRPERQKTMTGADINVSDIHKKESVYRITIIAASRHVPSLSGRSSSALLINSEQSSMWQLRWRNFLEVSCCSCNSFSVRTSRMVAPGASAAAFTSSGVLCVVIMLFVLQRVIGVCRIGNE